MRWSKHIQQKAYLENLLFNKEIIMAPRDNRDGSRYIEEQGEVLTGELYRNSKAPYRSPLSLSGQQISPRKRLRSTQETLACTELDTSRQEMAKLVRLKGMGAGTKDQDWNWFCDAFALEDFTESATVVCEADEKTTSDHMRNLQNFLTRDLGSVLNDIVEMQSENLDDL